VRGICSRNLTWTCSSSLPFFSSSSRHGTNNFNGSLLNIAITLTPITTHKPTKSEQTRACARYYCIRSTPLSRAPSCSARRMQKRGDERGAGHVDDDLGDLVAHPNPACRVSPASVGPVRFYTSVCAQAQTGQVHPRDRERDTPARLESMCGTGWQGMRGGGGAGGSAGRDRKRPSAATAWMEAACDVRSRLRSRSLRGSRQMPTTRSVRGSGSNADSDPPPAAIAGGRGGEVWAEGAMGRRL